MMMEKRENEQQVERQREIEKHGRRERGTTQKESSTLVVCASIYN